MSAICQLRRGSASSILTVHLLAVSLSLSTLISENPLMFPRTFLIVPMSCWNTKSVRA